MKTLQIARLLLKNGDRCWSIIEPFLPWIFAILKKCAKCEKKCNQTLQVFQNHFYVVFYNIKIKVEWLDYNNSIVVPVPLCHHLSCLFKTSISGQPFSSTIPGPPLIKNIKKIGLYYKMELFLSL